MIIVGSLFFWFIIHSSLLISCVYVLCCPSNWSRCSVLSLCLLGLLINYTRCCLHFQFSVKERNDFDSCSRRPVCRGCLGGKLCLTRDRMLVMKYSVSSATQQMILCSCARCGEVPANDRLSFEWLLFESAVEMIFRWVKVSRLTRHINTYDEAQFPRKLRFLSYLLGKRKKTIPAIQWEQLCVRPDQSPPFICLTQSKYWQIIGWLEKKRSA